ncbi:unnamed protein product, partial [marine sediment metagenome]
SPPYQLDQSYTVKAIEEFQSFIDFFPIDQKVEEAERKISELNLKLAEKEFNSARIYEKMEYYNASMDYYTKVYETYHDTEFAPKALYRKIYILLDKNIALIFSKYESLFEFTQFELKPWYSYNCLPHITPKSIKIFQNKINQKLFNQINASLVKLKSRLLSNYEKHLSLHGEDIDFLK